MLSPRQQQVLDIIRLHTFSGKTCPTLKEIAATLGIKSYTNVSRIVWYLIERGYIEHTPGRHRDLKAVS